MLVAPLVFRAPSGLTRRAGLLCAPVGGGPPARRWRCMLSLCGTAGVPGAGGPGRPRDRHTRACGSEWSISKPARALRSLRRPPHQWCLVADVWLGALTRCPARPCCQSHFTPSRRTLIVESTINFACNSLTALSNYEFRLLELQRFQTLLKLLSIELHATFLRPGPAVTFRLRGQALRLEVRLVPPVSATPGVLLGGA